MIQHSNALQCGAREPLVLKGRGNVHWVDEEVTPFAWSLVGQVILLRVCDALVSPSEHSSYQFQCNYWSALAYTKGFLTNPESVSLVSLTASMEHVPFLV